MAALSATAAAAALRPPISTGLNTEVFRLAAPLGLKLAAAAMLRPRGKPTGRSEAAPMAEEDLESLMLEATEDTGEPLSMPRGQASKMHTM